MKILVVGAGGFIGSFITNELVKKHIVIPVYTKDGIDLTNQDQVTDLLTAAQVDIVINCVTYGGKDKINETDSTIVAKNLAMFYNFYSNTDKFKKYFNIGSGAELDTRNDSAYAISKRAILHLIRHASFEQQAKFVTFRLYGCFGKEEIESRLLKKFLAKTETFEIKNDRVFDYISIYDFYNIIDYYIDKIEHGFDVFDSQDKEINCVYPDKYKISEFISLFCKINNIVPDFKIESEDSRGYTAYKCVNDVLDIKLYGIAHGMKAYI
jgi:nucleoside-diphosphate-sugar epimerase